MTVKRAGAYNYVLDYFPERRWRRWQITGICTIDRDGDRDRNWRCFTHAGACRLQARLHRRTERGLETLS